MTDNVKILEKSIFFEGYLNLTKYNLKIPSLNPSKKAVQQNREIVKTRDSVHVLLYAPKIDSIIFCEEFRPGVYFNENTHNPYIMQCVSGSIETDETPLQAAKKEIKEETGLEAGKLTLIAEIFKSPGILTEKSYLYYSEVTNLPEIDFHGIGDEDIKTHIIPRTKVYQLMDELKIIDSATLLTLNWLRLQLNSTTGQGKILPN